MIAYASRTGTRRNLGALREAGWRLMVSARGVLRTEGFRYALDNGAWTAHQKGEEFDVKAFERAVSELGAGADFIVAPDIVAGGGASLALSLMWIPELLPIAPVLLAVQDGMTPADVRPVLSERVGIFVGGSTDWKLATMPAWGQLRREVGCHVHIARVNTARRIHLALAAGAHSFDGSGPSRFAMALRGLDNARRQRALKAWNELPVEDIDD